MLTSKIKIRMMVRMRKRKDMMDSSLEINCGTWGMRAVTMMKISTMDMTLMKMRT